MKKFRFSTILFLVLLVVLSALFTGCGGVDEEYEYNDKIVTNDKAPVEGDANLTAISGFVADEEHKFVELPLTVTDETNSGTLEIVAIGKYTGPNCDGVEKEELKDAFAILVKNPTDKVLSVASLEITYDKGKTCSFNPSNIPAKQSALVFVNSDAVEYKNVKKLECADPFILMSDSLPMIEDKVGVDFKDGQFIITNRTDEALGDVYVRYKNFSDGNAYLGGITYSEVALDVQPYETRLIDAPDYSETNSIIIAVENFKITE